MESNNNVVPLRPPVPRAVMPVIDAALHNRLAAGERVTVPTDDPRFEIELVGIRLTPAAPPSVRKPKPSWRPVVHHGRPRSTPRPREGSGRRPRAAGRDGDGGRDDGGGGGDDGGGEPQPSPARDDAGAGAAP